MTPQRIIFVKRRDIDIDILKGVGMLLVIIGHAGCIWPFYPAINAFHMPLFFIVSGYFFSQKNTVWGGVKLWSKQLIFNYILLCAITAFLLFLLGWHSETFVKCAVSGTTITNDYNVRLGPVWFLLALFWCRVFYRILAEWVDINLRTIAILVTTLVIFSLSKWGWTDIYRCPLNLLQGVVCLFYYHTGVLLRQNDGFAVLKAKTGKYKLLFIVTSIIVLGFSVLFYRRVGANMNLSMLSAPLFPIDVLNAIALTLSLYVVINHVSYNVKRLAFFQNGLRWIGENSMAIFAVHCVEYHTTIPVMSGLSRSLMEVASSTIQKVFIITINPIVNIAICVISVMLWQQIKRIYQKGKTSKNENRNCDNLA